MPYDDPALVYLDTSRSPNDPSTHVLIVGVGRYEFGKGANETPVAGDLRQLTSPPISAREIADWFVRSFQNSQKPLGSVALLLSEDPVRQYQAPRPLGAPPVNVLWPSLRHVKQAAGEWAT